MADRALSQGVRQDSDPGDTTERWRDSYSRVRKDLFSDNQATNRARLSLLGVDALPREVPLLDLGAGDGNLHTSLRAAGFGNVWGLEYQPELAAVHPERARLVLASGTRIPFATASMDAVVVMDVLHHLPPEDLPACIDEMRRVLRPGGLLFVCEPASTLVRRALTVLLMSPLSRLTRFSRDKRAMVEQERETLEPWLEAEHAVTERITGAGFRVELFRRCWLHHYGRYRAV